MSRWALIPIFLVFVACSSDGGPPPGTEGAACPNDNNCERPLKCIDMVCTVVDGMDAGRRDLGVGMDANVADANGIDAGPVDTGLMDTGPLDADPMDVGPMDATPPCNLTPQLGAIQTEIFQPHCNTAGCHDVANAGGIRLDTPLATLHADLMGATVDPMAPQNNLVVPNEPANSRLYVICDELDPFGQGGPMPPNQRMPDCEVDTIYQWILDGALEN